MYSVVDYVRMIPWIITKRLDACVMDWRAGSYELVGDLMRMSSMSGT
jgi:hypothetical protein